MDDKQVHETDLDLSPDYATDQERNIALDRTPLGEIPKGRWDRSWPTIACGAGLFSDGYLNGFIGSVSTMLQLIYGDAYTSSSAKSAVPSIAFAGTVSMPLMPRRNESRSFFMHKPTITENVSHVCRSSAISSSVRFFL